MQHITLKNAKIDDFRRNLKNEKMNKKCRVQFPPPPQKI